MASLNVVERILCKWRSCDLVKHHLVFSNFIIYAREIGSGYFTNFLSMSTSPGYRSDRLAATLEAEK